MVARIVYDRRRRQPREGEDVLASVAEGGEAGEGAAGGGAGGAGGARVTTLSRRLPVRLPRLYVGVRGVTIQVGGRVRVCGFFGGGVDDHV